MTIKVTLGKRTVIDRINLSWVAFSPTTASFAVYGGQLNQNRFSGSNSKDIAGPIYQSDHTIYGLNLISITSGKGIAFMTDIDEDFVLSCSSSIQIDSFALVYIVIGPTPASLCKNCGAYNIVYEDQCVDRCPTTSYAHTMKDGTVVCKECSEKLGLILVGG